MLKDILWWIWLLPLIYFVFRFRREYWLLVLRLFIFWVGFSFGLEWVSWIRRMGSRDWVALLDQTPIGAKGFTYFCSALFGLAAIRVVEKYLLPPFLPPSGPTGQGGPHEL